jgi:hypothetical protein
MASGRDLVEVDEGSMTDQLRDVIGDFHLQCPRIYSLRRAKCAERLKTCEFRCDTDS